MSSDKYAQHLIQKYRLAVAIAVIQTNPESKSLDHHLIDLKNKLVYNDKMADDITVCSDDFDVDFNDFNDDASQYSDTILNNFNEAKISGNISLQNGKDVFPDSMDVVQDMVNEESQQNNNDFQSTFCETQTQLDNFLAPNSLTDIDKTFCDSISRIHKDNIMDIDKTCNDIAKIYNNTKIDRTTHCIDQANKSNDQNTEDINNESRPIADVNNTQNKNEIPNVKNTGSVIITQYFDGIAFDSQATELCTIPIPCFENTHVTQSQSLNFDVSDKYIKGIKRSSGDKGTNDNIDDTSVNTNTEFSHHIKDANLVRKINKNLEKQNVNMQVETYNFDQNTQTIDYRGIGEQLKQTQVPCVVYDSDLLPKNFKKDNLVRKIYKNLEQENGVQCKENNDFEHGTQINVNTNKDYGLSDNTLQEKRLNPINNNMQNFTQELFNIDTSQTHQFETQTQNTTAKHELSRNNAENMTVQVSNYSQRTHNVFNTDINKNIDVDNDSHEEFSQIELVPFKVMEELNRVKAYLNKGVERRLSNDSSFDSGYRSDSQGKNSQIRSRSGFQLSGNWVGQAGYCLFDHLTKCPLVATTEEILAEISEVLGQLIDRLHEQECYPSFLEDLLEHVESIIRCVFTEQDLVFDKDEKTQRLLLLNKSVHIQKYSIDKLTDILEDAHARFTHKDDLYELTNIHETENLSYIFHILEIILRKCLRNRKTASRSQETEKYQLRSSISDIWRKKWNPKYKEDLKIDSGAEKKCVFKKCNEILNKIVVGSMDGYSLVAFAALQCFNLLQT
ncbi:putative uncharacterized protein DDB_G0282133 [Plodia interpunctella]|uniref:putative uncharacterized protein DDB_G0282133 n=1 Tax=Plodia interpunctella TaxID=58824 RepID=UPI002368DACE|nr:putative uncharacterized protein DDB_G0282133 [Plodia interpunctella]